MVKFTYKEDHPLRIYMEGDPVDLERIVQTLRSMFYEETEYSKDEDVDNIVFMDGDSLYFPRGLYHIVVGILARSKIDISVDSYVPPKERVQDLHIDPDILSGVTLRPYQVDAANAALSHKYGIVQVSTGGGKTEIVLAMLRYLMQSTDSGKFIVCVPSTKLLYQTYDRALSRGIEEKDISILGDSNHLDTTKRVCIATVQTLIRRLDSEEYREWFRDLKMFVMDEAHHCSARTFFTVVDALHAEYTIGVTAEPFYNDATHKVQDLIVRGTLGSILYRILVPQLVELGYLSKPYLISFNSQSTKSHLYNSINWKVVYKELIIENPLRNALLVDIADALVHIGKNPLVLISQIKHGEFLASEISKRGHTVAMMTGGQEVALYYDGRIIEERVDKDGTTAREFTDGIIDVLIGTSVLDEGADIPSLSSVILAGGGKSPLKVVQRVGRGLRPKKGDNTTWIIDFLDNFNVVTKSHYKKRHDVLMQLGMPSYQVLNTQNLIETMEQYKSILINTAGSSNN